MPPQPERSVVTDRSESAFGEEPVGPGGLDGDEIHRAVDFAIAGEAHDPVALHHQPLADCQTAVWYRNVVEGHTDVGVDALVGLPPTEDLLEHWNESGATDEGEPPELVRVRDGHEVENGLALCSLVERERLVDRYRFTQTDTGMLLVADDRRELDESDSSKPLDQSIVVAVDLVEWEPQAARLQSLAVTVLLEADQHCEGVFLCWDAVDGAAHVDVNGSGRQHGWIARVHGGDLLGVVGGWMDVLSFQHTP